MDTEIELHYNCSWYNNCRHSELIDLRERDGYKLPEYVVSKIQEVIDWQRYCVEMHRILRAMRQAETHTLRGWSDESRKYEREKCRYLRGF